MSSRWCVVDMVGLCLRSRSLALLRCVWDGVRCLFDCVLCRGGLGGGGGERVTGVDCCSLLVGRCVHSGFLCFSSSCVSLN